MVQNKRMAVLALIVSAFGMGASGAASALPEMQVGTMIISSGQATATVDIVDDTAAEPADPEADESAS